MKQYPMQYADRLTPEDEALEILESEQFITVSTVDADGHPYATPLSYIVERGWGEIEGAPEDNSSTEEGAPEGSLKQSTSTDNEGPTAQEVASEGTFENKPANQAPIVRIYIHAGKGAGHKMEDWERDPRVWASVVTEVKPMFIDTFFTTAFASAMAAGTIRKVDSPVAMKKALFKLCMKYMPQMKSKIGFAIQDEFDKTDIWCIDVNYLTGKAGHRGE